MPRYSSQHFAIPGVHTIKNLIHRLRYLVLGMVEGLKKTKQESTS